MNDDLPPRAPRAPGLIAASILVALCLSIEGLLVLGDLNLFDIPRFRQVAYEFGGFWSGLLGNWRPNYPLQPYLMFFTYGFLHAGLIHLVLNMATLVSLALPVAARVGGLSMVLIYAMSMLGGGLGFALLSDSFRPMVGASGALFGLAGAVLAWEYVDRFTLQKRLWPVARAILFLLALNIALYYAMDRLLAWEAHLGGFVAGWIAALLIDPRSHAEKPSDP